MTTITKAAQDALTEFDRYFTSANGVDVPERVTVSRDEWRALRAALQDKAGEVWDARYWLEAIVDIWNDGDKAPEHRCYVEGAFSDAMREASALLTTKPAPVVPEFKGVARRKLIQLAGDGWQINGYAIRRGNERGFVDASGFVGWWRSEHGPVVTDDAECLDWIERQHLEELGMGLVIDAPNDGQYYVCGDSGATHYGKTLRDAIKGAIASQQKGGQHG